MSVDRKSESFITAEQVRDLFIYEPTTGLLRWRRNVGTRGRIGGIVGHPDRLGYLRVGLFGNKFYVHRVIWLIQTGAWPKDYIDHIDLNKANNKWINLREATHSENHCNTRAQKDSSTGVKGVFPLSGYPGKFTASIMKQGKRQNLGVFSSIEAAKTAYVAAAERAHGKFGRVA